MCVCERPARSRDYDGECLQGPWGSTYIDDHFLYFLGDLIGGLGKLTEPQLDRIMTGWESIKVTCARMQTNMPERIHRHVRRLGSLVPEHH